jgi:hypothetical protein
MSYLEILSQKSSSSHKECKDNPKDHATRPLEFMAENYEDRQGGGDMTGVRFICTG